MHPLAFMRCLPLHQRGGEAINVSFVQARSELVVRLLHAAE